MTSRQRQIQKLIDEWSNNPPLTKPVDEYDYYDEDEWEDDYSVDSEESQYLIFVSLGYFECIKSIADIHFVNRMFTSIYLMGEVDRKSLCLHHRYELDGKSTSDLVEDTFNQCLTFHKGMNISNKYVIWDNPLEIGKTRSSPSCYNTICGNCLLKIFMKSDYLKLFENKILSDKKGDNIIQKSKNKSIYALFCVDSAHHIINRIKLSLVYLTLLQYKPILDIICCHKTLFRRMIRVLFHDLEFWVKMDEEWDKHDLIRGDLESLNLYSLKSDIGHIRTLLHNFKSKQLISCENIIVSNGLLRQIKVNGSKNMFVNH